MSKKSKVALLFWVLVMTVIAAASVQRLIGNAKPIGNASTYASAPSNQIAANSTTSTIVTTTVVTTVPMITMQSGSITKVLSMVPSQYGWGLSGGQPTYDGQVANDSKRIAWFAYLAGICETYNADWRNASLFDLNGTPVFGCTR